MRLPGVLAEGGELMKTSRVRAYAADGHRDETHFFGAALAEVVSARAKFPSSEGAVVALMEEVGELAKAMMDESIDRVWAEAVQVACMACRVAVEMDPTLDAIRARRVK